MDDLPDPPRWTVRPLQGVAGCWPPAVVGRDVFDRVTVAVMIPGVCTVTVAFVPPDPSSWGRFPPWRFRRRWWGWQRRRRLRLLLEEDHLADPD